MRSGRLTCLNPCGSAFFFPLLNTGLGASSELLSFWKLEGNCVVCSKPVKAMRGLFCANSHFSRGEWTPCLSIWHAECYTCLGQDKVKFPTSEIKDTEGNTWHQEEGRLRRLNQGVEGAHLCTSFQCELCWFRNLTGKDPTPGVHDMALRCLRRCNLDNFAGRAPSTIRGHKLEIFTLGMQFKIHHGERPDRGQRSIFYCARCSGNCHAQLAGLSLGSWRIVVVFQG